MKNKDEYIVIKKSDLINVLTNKLERMETYEPKNIDYLYGYCKGARVAVNDLMNVSNLDDKEQYKLNDELHTRMDSIVSRYIDKKNRDVFII